ncbi:M20 family metallo-hydrolase [Evansella sp. LMS18]|jgi:N-carbamoyl-L-amino-acid hydrolase|uniref:M20 family metallo-hydrolase n=1 Tax=Evansella sp. LMS18 TaxID=2924033 RepID=UPI0020D0D9CC|nr:M20 family metallo-hydrolase [Evansella sp. LMS18]UTR11846.1 M20 family metallo-hydrolase [Evansella sp. LMS18]
MKEWLEETLKKLNLTDSMIQKDGFTRLGYSEDELKSMDVFKQISGELGLTVRTDEAGNVIARWEEGPQASDLPAVTLGSHVDTVKHGGGYDGVAGVLCALGAVKKLKDEGYKPAYPVEVICFASEESSRFGVSTIGSKAMAGILDTNQLANIADENGVTIKEAVESTGLDWSAIGQAERETDEIKSFAELHIEQGTVIENAGAQFGAVSAVACPIRLKLIINGKMGHTGTTPMGMRQDALAAAAPVISFVAEEGARLSRESEDRLVATVSTISAVPNAMNVIPGIVELGIDIRSVNDSLKENMAKLISDKVVSVEKEYTVSIEVEELVNNPSVTLDKNLMESLGQLGEQEGYQSHEMISGAGHDVMNMAKKWPSGLVFIPCRDGLSHHPEEHASLEDLEMGTNILAAYIKNEAE